MAPTEFQALRVQICPGDSRRLTMLVLMMLMDMVMVMFTLASTVSFTDRTIVSLHTLGGLGEGAALQFGTGCRIALGTKLPPGRDNRTTVNGGAHSRAIFARMKRINTSGRGREQERERGRNGQHLM